MTKSRREQLDLVVFAYQGALAMEIREEEDFSKMFRGDVPEMNFLYMPIGPSSCWLPLTAILRCKQCSVAIDFSDVCLATSWKTCPISFCLLADDVRIKAFTSNFLILSSYVTLSFSRQLSTNSNRTPLGNSHLPARARSGYELVRPQACSIKQVCVCARVCVCVCACVWVGFGFG